MTSTPSERINKLIEDKSQEIDSKQFITRVAGVTHPAKQRKKSQASIQADLDEADRLYELERAFKEEVLKPYKEVKDRICTYMVSSNLQELDCINTGRKFKLKERANWTYSQETPEIMTTLKGLQKYEQDVKMAKNDPTHYVSPLPKCS